MSMGKFDIVRQKFVSPCHFGDHKCLPQMQLLSHIDGVDDFRWIPSIREAILDSGEITREIESCSILFLEDTRWEFRLLREYDSYTSIIILGGNSLFY
jgi:hypothetical protein